MVLRKVSYYNKCKGNYGFIYNPIMVIVLSTYVLSSL